MKENSVLDTRWSVRWDPWDPIQRNPEMPSREVYSILKGAPLVETCTRSLFENISKHQLPITLLNSVIYANIEVDRNCTSSSAIVAPIVIYCN